MRHKFAFQRIALAATAAGAALILSACGAQSTSTTGQSGETADTSGASRPAASTGTSFNDADVAFAQMMIPDHQMTAKMAELAQNKAATEDLKSMAAQMVKGESQTVDTLQGWLETWGKPASGDMAVMTMPGAMTDKDMDMLKSMSGMDFDMMFAQMMVKHHEGSIQMAQDEQAKGASAEAKAMAADMVKTQQAQVSELRKIATM
jgi:uncharacterized protein (DUF305 family)